MLNDDTFMIGFDEVRKGTSAVRVRYNEETKTITITGDGYPEGDKRCELLIAAGFRNLTIKQANAMELGLRVMEFLRTGKYPTDINFGNPQFEPNVVIDWPFPNDPPPGQT